MISYTTEGKVISHTEDLKFSQPWLRTVLQSDAVRSVVWQICTDMSQVLDALIARSDKALCTIIKTKAEGGSLQIT